VSAYRDPTFQDRVGRAAEAKQKALDQLRSRPARDEGVVAARIAAGLKREAAASDKRAARSAAEQALEAENAAAAAQQAAIKPPPTEAERKAARDAKYAARKSRR
jgi:hypothetical protein